MKTIILAAGKGKRLLSEKFNAPKVLRQANGKPLIGYVLQSLSFMEKKEDIIIVVGYKKELVMEQLGEGYTYVEQTEQLGTGHAVNMARNVLADYDGPVLICYGDMPLFKESTYREMIDTHVKDQNDCTILTGVSDRKLAYGRILRDENGAFVGSVEDKDCTPEQKEIKELNVGVYVFDSKKLFSVLGEIRNNNAQGEYYLPDASIIMLRKGMKVSTYTTHDGDEILGVNTPEELATCEEILKKNGR